MNIGPRKIPLHRPRQPIYRLQDGTYITLILRRRIHPPMTEGQPHRRLPARFRLLLKLPLHGKRGQHKILLHLKIIISEN